MPIPAAASAGPVSFSPSIAPAKVIPGEMKLPPVPPTGSKPLVRLSLPVSAVKLSPRSENSRVGSLPLALPIDGVQWSLVSQSPLMPESVPNSVIRSFRSLPLLGGRGSLAMSGLLPAFCSFKTRISTCPKRASQSVWSSEIEHGNNIVAHESRGRNQWPGGRVQRRAPPLIRLLPSSSRALRTRASATVTARPAQETATARSSTAASLRQTPAMPYR